MRPGPVLSPLLKKGTRPGARVTNSLTRARVWNPDVASGLKFVSGRPKPAFDGLLAVDLRPGGPGCPCLAPIPRTLRKEFAVPQPGGEHPAWTRTVHRERRPLRSLRHMAWAVDGRRWDNRSHEVCTSLPWATVHRSSFVQPRKRGIATDFRIPATGATVDKPTAVASTKALTGRMLKLSRGRHTANPPSEDGFIRVPNLGQIGVAFRGLSCTRVRASIRPVLP